ncbi:hypothetical protein AB0F13_27785 [Streptomyces sp. NPDC026206]|uniref:hypothetical protein n=1 Tax=Streptomyces sp. NPDC026206 TaxID=3157089 RepID=UPI0033CDCC3F
MIRRTALCILTTVAVTATLALPLTQGAQAATPATTAPVTAATPATVNADDDNPFRWMELDGLPADVQFMRSHPRVEVRYGDPDHPNRARVVASATTLM